MIFWSIVFFTASFYNLIRGGMFRSTFNKIKKIQIERIESGNNQKYDTELLKAGCLSLILGFSLFIAQVIFLINAIEYDVYKYPTIALIILIIISIIRIKKDKSIEDMTPDELIIHKAKLLKPLKRTFIQTFRSLLWVIYYGYMFYVLVFLNT